MIKKWVVHFLVFFIALVVTVIAADFAIKWALKIPSNFLRGIVRFDPALSPPKRLKPNLRVDLTGDFREFRFHLSTTNDGFRRSDAPGIRESVKPDVILLGDSQTFGVGVNDQDTFAARLSQKLKLPVLNTACPGYNTIEQLRLIESLLKSEHPKYVVLAFFAGNDPYENYANRGLLEGKQDGGPAVKGTESKKPCALSALKNFLVKNSSIYNCLMRLRRFEVVDHGLRAMRLINSEPPAELAIFRRDRPLEKLKFWNVTERAIHQINRAVTASGAKLVLLNLPDRYQVDRAYWDLWVKKYGLSPAQYDLSGPNAHLRRYCEDEQIPFLDVTKSLRWHAAQGESVYWALDNHLSPKGHEVVAEFLFEYFVGAIAPVS